MLSVLLNKTLPSFLLVLWMSYVEGPNSRSCSSWTCAWTSWTHLEISWWVSSSHACWRQKQNTFIRPCVSQWLFLLLPIECSLLLGYIPLRNIPDSLQCSLTVPLAIHDGSWWMSARWPHITNTHYSQRQGPWCGNRHNKHPLQSKTRTMMWE